MDYLVPVNFWQIPLQMISGIHLYRKINDSIENSWTDEISAKCPLKCLNSNILSVCNPRLVLASVQFVVYSGRKKSRIESEASYWDLHFTSQ